ncbi:lipopolysaccharide biosynthesis protein [Zunongwangia sp. F260]|uniref:Lipopolysaccharide biosynthesis protein n=1 Tax=Autumnicola lenta TaxID=3075593 RepID=A0ABU3CHT3_9FLAO|nr:lipopolysaccharide biosynthesis protein [Zunongwangia sp. F260]MDT0645907.1 lipopolysaccharide biosynthesis protein [Zunongwangia sp. F260]
MSLQKKALSGVSWTFLEQFGSKAINFIVQIVLARLIAPEEFGLLGMILIFNAIGNSLSDTGMSQSLIRSDKPDEEDFSTVFSINFTISFLLYWIFFIIAPYISEFYEQPRLTDLIRVYSIVIIISSLFIIQKTRLTYELNFKYQMKAQLPALFLSGLTGILLAYLDYGVWALVYMQIVNGLFLTITYFLQTRWIPNVKINRSKLKEHFLFGYKLTLAGIMSRIVKNIFPMVIGKYYSAAMVGYYTRAFTMKELPVVTISNTLDKVVYPLLAKIKNDDRQLKAAYQKIQILSLFVLSTIMLLLILIAHPLFGFLLGEKWLPAVPFFQLLCITGIFYPINKYNSNILKVKGRTDLYLKMAIIVNITMVLGIIVTVEYGIIPLILAQVINSLIGVGINIYYANQFIKYPYIEQFVDAFKTALPGLISFALIFYLIEFYNIMKDFNYFLELLIIGGLFMAILISLHFLFRTRALKEIHLILKLVPKGKMFGKS